MRSYKRREEAQETAILLNRGQAFAEIWSDCPSVVAKLRKYPGIEEIPGSSPPTFRCPQAWIRLKRPKVPTLRFATKHYKAGKYRQDPNCGDILKVDEFVRGGPLNVAQNS